MNLVMLAFASLIVAGAFIYTSQVERKLDDVLAATKTANSALDAQAHQIEEQAELIEKLRAKITETEPKEAK